MVIGDHRAKKMALIDDRIKRAQAEIDSAKERLKQAKALKQKKEARVRAKDAKAQRSADTRRKILVGQAILANADGGDWPKERLLEVLNQSLTRPHDRALFGLSQTPKEPNPIDVTPKISPEEQQNRLKAIDFARASMKLSGFTPSPEVEARSARYANGEINLQEFVNEGL
jgi:large subunit ribosomal protein L7/L12